MSSTISIYSANFLKNLLVGNREKCSEICHNFLNEDHSIQTLYEELLKPALHEVGVLWEQNKISVATEHLATAITERIMNEFYGEIASTETNQKKVVLACVENERHQVGIKMVADVFEMHGWESFFLGTSIPLGELVKYVTEIKPNILAISLSIYFNYSKLIDTINTFQEKFPNMRIIIGGQALNNSKNALPTQFKNVLYLKNLYEIDTFLTDPKNIIA